MNLYTNNDMKSLLAALDAEHRCCWLVGDVVDIDVLFAESTYEFRGDVELVENYDLFSSAVGYKCALSKEMLKTCAQFFEKSDRTCWNKNLLIKASMGQLESIKKCVDIHDDCVIVLDELKTAQLNMLIDWFVKKYSAYNCFNAQEMLFVKQQARSLKDVVLCSLLQSVGIVQENWHEFLSQEEVSWYKKMKEGTLLLEGLSNSIIPVMQYMMRADNNVVRAGVLQYLAAAIKDGAKVYEHDELWKELV